VYRGNCDCCDSFHPFVRVEISLPTDVGTSQTVYDLIAVTEREERTEISIVFARRPFATNRLSKPQVHDGRIGSVKHHILRVDDDQGTVVTMLLPT
jgi:hypothetical protein